MDAKGQLEQVTNRAIADAVEQLIRQEVTEALDQALIELAKRFRTAEVKNQPLTREELEIRELKVE